MNPSYPSTSDELTTLSAALNPIVKPTKEFIDQSGESMIVVDGNSAPQEVFFDDLGVEISKIIEGTDLEGAEKEIYDGLAAMDIDQRKLKRMVEEHVESISKLKVDFKNKDMDPWNTLTDKQELFAWFRGKGYSQVQSYQKAGYSQNCNLLTQGKEAWQLDQIPKVRRRVYEWQLFAEKDSSYTQDEHVKTLKLLLAKLSGTVFNTGDRPVRSSEVMTLLKVLKELRESTTIGSGKNVVINNTQINNDHSVSNSVTIESKRDLDELNYLSETGLLDDFITKEPKLLIEVEAKEEDAE